jgi:hypothetical protein
MIKDAIVEQRLKLDLLYLTFNAGNYIAKKLFQIYHITIIQVLDHIFIKSFDDTTLLSFRDFQAISYPTHDQMTILHLRL